MDLERHPSALPCHLLAAFSIARGGPSLCLTVQTMAAASSDDPGPPGEKRFEIKKWSAVTAGNATTRRLSVQSAGPTMPSAAGPVHASTDGAAAAWRRVSDCIAGLTATCTSPELASEFTGTPECSQHVLHSQSQAIAMPGFSDQQDLAGRRTYAARLQSARSHESITASGPGPGHAVKPSQPLRYPQRWKRGTQSEDIAFRRETSGSLDFLDGPSCDLSPRVARFVSFTVAQDFIKYLHNEKDRMQQKLEGLENERQGVIAQWQQLVAENEDLRKELRSKNRQLEGENSDLKEALTKLQNRLEELNSFENFADGELADAKAKAHCFASFLLCHTSHLPVAKLQKENASLQKQVEVQRKLREDEQRASEEKNRRWARECSGVGAGTGEEAAQSPATPELATSSENRLRMAMIDSSSSSAQLKDAISAVESLLGEADCNADIVRQLFPSHQAKREMKNKQLSGPDMAMARQRGVEVYNLCRSRFRRERRAAFEQLHAALEANDEHALAQAVEAARMAEVEAEDVAKAEAGACDANRQPNGKHCRTLHSSMDFLLSRRRIGDRSSWLMA
eukprot:s1812_g10.t1